MGIRGRIQKAFFGYGWLLPTLLPVTQVGGRGLFNVFSYGYVIWAAAALYREKIHLDRVFLILYGLVLMTFLLGVPAAQDSVLAFKAWGIFLLHSLAGLFTLMVLERDPANLERLQRALGIGGLVTLLFLYIELGYLLSREGFDPRHRLKEDNLPFLLPFMLIGVWAIGSWRWRYPALAGLCAATLTYVFVSEGRAALLGVVVALTVYGLLVAGWRPLWVGLGVLILVVLSVSVMPNAADQHPGWHSALDAFTSGRSVLWRQALEKPPDSALIGVGMGNGRFESEILHIGPEPVKHLHNFILDAWRETGVLGVFALLSLIAYGLGRVAWAWYRLSLPQRHRAGVFLAAALAILASALLSFSYTSRQFSLYLFICFAVLVHLAGRVEEEDGGGERV